MSNTTESYYTTPIANINRRIYWFGLSPLQAALAIFGIIFMFMLVIVTGKTILFLLPVASIYLVYRIFRKAHEENSNGNPDYIKGYINSMQGSKSFEDQNECLKFLKCEKLK